MRRFMEGRSLPNSGRRVDFNLFDARRGNDGGPAG
jgi:hypothetical protein